MQRRTLSRNKRRALVSVLVFSVMWGTCLPTSWADSERFAGFSFGRLAREFITTASTDPPSTGATGKGAILATSQAKKQPTTFSRKFDSDLATIMSGVRSQANERYDVEILLAVDEMPELRMESTDLPVLPTKRDAGSLRQSKELRLFAPTATGVSKLENATNVLTLPIDPVAHFEQTIARHRQNVRDALAEQAGPILDWLAANGATDIREYQNLPLIKANVGTTALQSAFLHQNTRIAQIGLELHQEAMAPLYAHAGIEGAMRGKQLVGGACGGACVGLGLKAAIWEHSIWGGTGVIAAYNPRFWYADVEEQTPATSCTSDTQCVGDNTLCYITSGPNAGKKPTSDQPGQCVAEHASVVASIIGAYGVSDDDPGYKQQGVVWPHYGAYQTRFLNANGFDSAQALNWALEKGALYINRSASTSALSPSSTLPALIDWAARYQYVTFTLAAGNDGESETSRVDGESFNAITVGAYYFGDWEDRSDDRVTSWSAYRNPQETNPGVERPHLVAPGSRLIAPSICDRDFKKTWISQRGCRPGHDNATGTSFAAPAILGTAIRIHEYEGLFSQLIYPGMRKAVLMVGAADANQDGPIPEPDVDAKDGAGVPNMARIKAILDGDRYRTVRLTPSDFRSSSRLNYFGDGYEVARVRVPAGHALRAGLVYNSCSDGNGSNALGVDLDLHVNAIVDTFIDDSLGVPAGPPSACFTGAQSVSEHNEFELVYLDCLKNSTSAATFSIRIEQKEGTGFDLCRSETSEPAYVVWDYVPVPASTNIPLIPLDAPPATLQLKGLGGAF